MPRESRLDDDIGCNLVMFRVGDVAHRTGSSVPMKLLRLLSLLALASCALAAHATVLDFEGISGLVGEQYASLGLHFTNAEILTSPSYDAANYPPRSGLNVAYDSGSPITIHFDTPTGMVGAYVTTYAGPLTIEAYNGTTLIGSVSTPFIENTTGIGPGPNYFLSVSASGITDVRFFTQSTNTFTMDDLTFSASAVPGPAAALAFGVGLIRRRKRA